MTKMGRGNILYSVIRYAVIPYVEKTLTYKLTNSLINLEAHNGRVTERLLKITKGQVSIHIQTAGIVTTSNVFFMTMLKWRFQITQQVNLALSQIVIRENFG